MKIRDPEKKREADRRYRQAHKEQERERVRKWRKANPEWVRVSNQKHYDPEHQRRWRAANGERCRSRQRSYEKQRRCYDRNYWLAKNLRIRMSHVLRGDIKAGSAVADLGCTIEALKSWLQYQFQPGMTWDNYGEWEIDHVKPLASFDLTDREQFLVACNWYNLQPLWKADNRSKGDRS